MPVIAVTKMHGAFNDFVVVDARRQDIGDAAAFARYVCDRRAGIGADGLLVVASSTRAAAAMRVVNADGSSAEMCGNGLRCVARYLSENGEGDRLRIETGAGVLAAEIVSKGEVYGVRLTLDPPTFVERPLPFDDAAYVVVGNPHLVLFEDALDTRDVVEIGSALQRSPEFPGGINVHLAVCADAHHVHVRHYERGVGATFACGTGSVAAVAAAIARGACASPVEVHVPGGELTVEWDGRGPAFLGGPAVRVFDTQIEARAPRNARVA